jgi:hypothetical protein
MSSLQPKSNHHHDRHSAVTFQQPMVANKPTGTRKNRRGRTWKRALPCWQQLSQGLLVRKADYSTKWKVTHRKSADTAG